MKQSPYREPDVGFGQTMLTLRTITGLTQAGLAEYLGVSRRAVGEWEAGNTYPKTQYLKQFIALAFKQQAFTAGREAEEIRALWKAARQKVLLDEVWLTQLLVSATTIRSGPTNGVAPVLVPSPTATPMAASTSRLDWGEAPNSPVFYGREGELSELRKWVIEERCRVVSLLGLGGMGKSTLAVNFMFGVAEHFEVVLWRSLRDAPDCESLLDSCLQTLAPEMLNERFSNLDQRLRLLLKQLQGRRVLLVLDNLETLLEEGQDSGYMRKGYESYDRLLRLVAETAHQSCLLLTSREKPIELVPLEGIRSAVRVLRLTRLDDAACQQLLLDKGVTGTSLQRVQLGEIFTGNPLALKIVAQTIVDLFEGEIAPFLAQGQSIFGGIRQLLDQQFARLSTREQTVLLWLAILREPANLDELLAALLKPLPRVQLLETVEALHRRSLIERGEKPGSFSLQSVVLEYLTTRLVGEVAQELVQGKPLHLLEHSLLQAQARDYVRQSQQRLIIQPVLTQLKDLYGTADRAENYLSDTLAQLRKLPPTQQGYGGGNILNLLIGLGSNLAGWDFSGLNLWQAYLAVVELHQVNLTGCDLRRSVFTQAFNSILILVYSPDGKFLAGGSLAGDIKIWQFNQQTEGTGYSLHLECRGHSDMVSSVAYSPDGRFLASGSYDRTIRLWDANSGEILLVLEGHTDTVQSVVFSPDGRLLASGSFDGTIRLWRVATGEQVAMLAGHTGWVFSVAFSPDGLVLASGSLDGTVRLWETTLATGRYQPTAILSGHQGWVIKVIFSLDGQTLYSSSSNATIRVWSVAEQVQLQILEGHSGLEQAMALSPDGATLASGGADRTIRLWQLGSDKLYHSLLGHTAPIAALAFSPDSATLASSSSDRSVRLWSVQNGEGLVTLQGHTNSIMSVAVSSDGAYIASTAGNNQVVVWQLDKLSLPATKECLPSIVLKGHTSEVFSVAFSRDKAQLASAGRDATIKLWDITRLNERNQRQTRLTLTGHTEVINATAFSPLGNLLASGSTDNTVRLWSTINGELISTLEGHQTTIWSVSFSPDGNILASGSNDGTIHLWNIRSGQLISGLNTEKLPGAHLAYHSTAQLLACARYNGTIQVWQTSDSFQPPLILKGHQGLVWSVAFNPASVTTATLVSGGADGTVRLWDIERGEEVARFQHEGFVRSVAFTPDGKSAISAGDSGLIKLWDIASGQLLATFRDFRLYEGVNITGATGLTAAQRTTLLALGAVENPPAQLAITSSTDQQLSTSTPG